MSREIRRVPPNWKHPCYTEDNAPYNSLRSVVGEYMSMVDEDYKSAAIKWIDNFSSWQRGDHPDQKKEWVNYQYYWEYEGPPDEEIHRPVFEAEPTWYQMYETVSEGTPVTPPFATKAELITWLIEKGESHNTQYEHRFTREQATAFVDQKWAPSFVFTSERGLESGVEHSETFQKSKDKL